ncbi:MAG: hypothetical protein HRT47_08885 [Candidatus Caenarcaniphilales bacterium]|nr:hypothetical protein [Candidatus Caenarcaniphilales bacterium]
MSDISKGGFDGKKIAESREAYKNKKDDKAEVPQDTQHRQEHLNKVQAENRGRYSGASSSQKEITKAYREKHQDQFVQDQKVKEDQKKQDFKDDAFKKQVIETEKDKALVKNPILKSKLDLSAKKQSQTQEQRGNQKAKPPRPSLKSLLAHKGVVNKKMSYKELIDLNPSLKRVSSKDMDNLQELGKVLEGQYIAELAESEAKANNKLSGTKQKAKQPSVTDLFQLGDEILDLDSDELHDLVSELTEGLESEEIKNNIVSVLNLFQENKPIQNQLLLYFPLPLPFEFKDFDEEFEEELEELRKENQDKDQQDETYEEEDDEDEEFEADMEAAISIHTYNFGKLMALLRFSKSLNKLEVTFKGAPNAEELAIALSSNLEFELPFQTNIKERRYKTWKNKTFPNIPSDQTRPSIIQTTGEPDEQFIKACKVIFSSVQKSDQEVTQFEANKEGKIV